MCARRRKSYSKPGAGFRGPAGGESNGYKKRLAGRVNGKEVGYSQMAINMTVV